MSPEELDWLVAEREYLAQRPIDGSIPRKQLWHEDTIEQRAYRIFLARGGDLIFDRRDPHVFYVTRRISEISGG